MKDQYVGDIGDYVKLALLRAISPGHRLGVLWYLTPDDPTKKDGRFTGYLDRPALWRGLDCYVFDYLKEIVGSNRRAVGQLEAPQLLPECQLYWRCVVPCPPAPDFRSRLVARSRWFASALGELNHHDCDLVFLDPDNGIQPLRCKPTHARSAKHVLLSELRELRDQAPRHRTMVVYYHNTRKRGGHDGEVLWLCDRMRGEGFRRVQALRARSHSARTFIILDALSSVAARMADFAKKWREHGVDLSG